MTKQIYEEIKDHSLKVVGTEKKEKQKYKPRPLNTIEFQKLGTQKLHMSSDKLMENAEKLYQKGIISYPRTETNLYNKNIDLKQLLKY